MKVSTNTGKDPMNILKLNLSRPDLLPPGKSPFESELPSDGYRELSTKLGVNQPVLLLADLQEVLMEESMGIYSMEKVVAYLDGICEQRNKGKKPWDDQVEWKWLPVAEYPDRYRRTNRDRRHFTTDLYGQAIPEPVLHTMDRIKERCPDVQFFVSEIRTFPDPFLAVSVPGSDTLHVIERWNEPSFRG